MSNRFTRRYFLKGTAGIAAAYSVGPFLLRGQNLNGKVNLAAIGCGGKGESDIRGASGLKIKQDKKDDGQVKETVEGMSENVVALCDVDRGTLDKALTRYKGAKPFQDYREMLDKMGKEIDALTISTPDHHHAPAAIRAMALGKHVYVQKPLTHTIWEARTLTEAARKYKVQTIMGNQGHSGPGWRSLCEMVWSDAIGDVTELHAWSNRPIWPQGIDRPEGEDKVPGNLDWDIWIGAAPMRPFKKGVYHPFNWRGFWDFGTGALGDMGCHIIDGPFWAMYLHHPKRIEIVDSSELKKETAPKWCILKYHFDERTVTLPNGVEKKFPACTLTWWDGGKQPPRPKDLEPGVKIADGQNGTIFYGSKGTIVSGSGGGGVRLLPREGREKPPKPPEIIPRVKDHYGEWIGAIKGGKPASGNFDYAGPLTEMVLLGNLVLRAGKSIDWDSKNLKSPNSPEATALVTKEYRKGWEVVL